MNTSCLATTLVIATVLGGCLHAPVAAPASTAATSTTTPSVTAVEPPALTMGVVGSPITQNDSVAYRVDTAAQVAVTLRLDGAVHASETVSGNKTWTLPLTHGRTSLNVSVEAPGLRRTENVTLVRLGPTSLRIDYCYYHPSSPTARKAHDYAIWIDVDSRPSEPLYAAAGAKHVDSFTAHDQLYLFEQLTKIPVEVQYFASLQGFAVNKIDGVGNPVSASAPPYWLYTVNGNDGTGMSLQVVKPGDRVVWSLSCAG